MQLINITILIILLLSPSVHAQSIISNIPEKCTNKKGLYLSKDSKISAGPTWVEKCENVCVLDQEKIISKNTLWYSGRNCDQIKRYIIFNKCRKSDRHPDCNEIIADINSEENHDCFSNQGGENVWRCAERAMPVICSYYADTELMPYNNSINYAFCEKSDDTAEVIKSAP